VRLFVGIALPLEVREAIGELLDELIPLAALRWSRASDLHLTTKFIGAVEPARVAEFEHALSGMEVRAPIPIAVRGVGWFPRAADPRVFWAGIAAPDGLADLAADTDAALGALGVARETREFSPHVTLARVPNRASRVSVSALASALDQRAARGALDFGAFTVDRFSLYESGTADRDTRYRILTSFPLRR
jgi:2'-5' RNA ligase